MTVRGVLLVLVYLVILAGVGLIAFGTTIAIIQGPGHPAPNVNHVSTIPTPPRR